MFNSISLKNSRCLFTILFIFLNLYSNSQIIGGRESDQLTPQEVSPAEITKGAFQGDVNLFNGTYSASYPLGSISTTQGLMFNLSMNYSPSFTTGATPSSVDGIPYGKGWDVSVPSISVTSDTEHKYYDNASQVDVFGNDQTSWTAKEAIAEGKSYWFAPTISIPGVASGRAVFKYVDKETRDAIFTLHGFEKPIEIRFRNGAWLVELDNGDYYRFDVAEASLRQGSGIRGMTFSELEEYINDYFPLVYEQLWTDEFTEAMQHSDGAGSLADEFPAPNEGDAVEFSSGSPGHQKYERFREAVRNAVMPSYEYTKWMCTEMGNYNYPNESIHFEYNRYGEFDYFAEFTQAVNRHAFGSHFKRHAGYVTQFAGLCQQLFIEGNVDLEFPSVYKDIHLSEIYSVNGTVRERLEMNYETEFNFSESMLDHRDGDVFRKDSLYSYREVYSQGVESEQEFSNWKRYYHWRSDAMLGHVADALSPPPGTVDYSLGFFASSYSLSDLGLANPKNPYVGALPSPGSAIYADVSSLSNINGPMYARHTLMTENSLSFNHGFLESPRLNNAVVGSNSFVPGDTYEVRTNVLDTDDYYDFANYDINVVTGPDYIDSRENINNSSYKSFISGGTNDRYTMTRGETIFTTFNQPIKWNKAFGGNYMTGDNADLGRWTSNFFTLPNLPSDTYQGFNIQIGPGNSDNDFATPTSDVWNSGDHECQAYSTYSFENVYGCNEPVNHMSCGEPMPRNFGIGLPWSMTLRMYGEFYDHFPVPDNDDLSLFPNRHGFHSWFNDDPNSFPMPNVPTLFDEQVVLNGVKVIRHSKNPYMLKGVTKYVTNGEVIANEAEGNTEAAGLVMVDKIELEYSRQAVQLKTGADWTNPRIDNYSVRKYSAETGLFYYPADEVQFSSVPGYSAHTQNVFQLVSARHKPIEREEFTIDQTILSIPSTTWTYEIFEPESGSLYSPEFGVTEMFVLTEIQDELGGRTKLQFMDFGYMQLPDIVGLSALPSDVSWTNQGYDETTVFKVIDMAPMDNIHIQNMKPIKYELNPIRRNPLPKREDEIFRVTPMLASITTFKEDDNALIREYDYGNKILGFGNSASLGSGVPNVSENWTFRKSFVSQSDFGFDQTTVIDPTVNGSQSKSIYHFIGGSEDNYDELGKELLFGKVWKTEMFTDDILLSESITDYEYNLAFENGAIRIRDKQWEYGDYIDYYTGVGGIFNGNGDVNIENLHAHVIPSSLTDPVQRAQFIASLTNDQGELDLPRSFASTESSWGVMSFPSFYEIPFAENYSNNPSYLNSYFIKKVKETTRTFESNGQVIIPCPIIPDYGVLGQEKEGGFVNEVFNENNSELMAALQESPESEMTMSSLIESSPLGDSILTALIGFHPSYLLDVLNSQPDLSTPVLLELLVSNEIGDRDVMSVLSSLPTLGDLVILELLSQEDRFRESDVLTILNRLPSLSEDVKEAIAETEEGISETLRTKLLIDNSVTDNVMDMVLDEANGYSESQVRDIILARGQLSQAHFESIFQRQEPISVNTLMGILESMRSYPEESTLEPLLSSGLYDSDELVSILSMCPIGFSSEFKTLMDNSQLFSLEQFTLIGPYNAPDYVLTDCGCLIEDVAMTEQITEFDYWDADHTGKVIGSGFSELFGLDSDVQIDLKYEPSWQLYSTKSYSPQMPEVYNKTEYFYAYDLKNRYDRHLDEDLFPGHSLMTIDLEVGEFPDFSIGRWENEVFFDEEWWSIDVVTPELDDYYPSGNESLYRIPPLPVMVKAQENRLHGIVVQLRNTAKNNPNDRAVVSSQYFHYDTYWPFDFPIPVVEHDYDGDYCGTDYNSDNDSDNGSDDDGGSEGEWVDSRFVVASDTELMPYRLRTDNNGENYIPIVEKAQYLPDALEGKRLMLKSVYQQVDSLPWSFNSDLSLVTDFSNCGIFDYQPILDESNVVTSYFSFSPPEEETTTVLVYDDDGNIIDEYYEYSSAEVDYYTWHYVEETFIDDITGEEYTAIVDSIVIPWAETSSRDFLFEPVFPFDVLKTYEVHSRNMEGLPMVTADEKGLLTKIEYADHRERVWNNPTDPACPNFTSERRTYFGLPESITVGFSRPDARTMHYDYDKDYRLNSITDHRGSKIDYTYDSWNRLETVKSNDQLISDFSYSNWTGPSSDLFLDRTMQNFVLSRTYYDETRSSATKSFIDPLGRSYGTAARTMYDDGFGNQDVLISSGMIEYDEWARPIKEFQSTAWALSDVGFNPMHDPMGAFQEIVLENDKRGRPLVSADPGVELNSEHTVRNEYGVVDIDLLTCELDLSATEVQRLFGPLHEEVLVSKTKTVDQDGNESFSYSNAAGQLLAQRAQLEEDLYAVTLYIYDSYGNLTTVINPLKQESHYRYNSLGWMYEKETPDEGLYKYMFDRSGNIVLSQDANQRAGLPIEYLYSAPNLTVDPVFPYYSAYEYNAYGQLINEQIVSASPDPLMYETVSRLDYFEDVEGDDVLEIDEDEFLGDLNMIDCDDYYENNMIDQLPLEYYFTNRSTMDWLATIGLASTFEQFNALPANNGSIGSGSLYGLGLEDVDHDFDNDGVMNDVDNCPCDFNPNQENDDLAAGDVAGNACDEINNLIYTSAVLITEVDPLCVLELESKSIANQIAESETQGCKSCQEGKVIPAGTGGSDFVKNLTDIGDIIVDPDFGEGSFVKITPLSYYHCLSELGSNTPSNVNFGLASFRVYDLFRGGIEHSEEVINEYEYGDENAGNAHGLLTTQRSHIKHDPQINTPIGTGTQREVQQQTDFTYDLKGRMLTERQIMDVGGLQSGGQPYSMLVEYQEYDRQDNLLRKKVTLDEGDDGANITAYYANVFDGFGRLKEVHADDWPFNPSDYSRVASYEYDNATGLLIERELTSNCGDIDATSTILETREYDIRNRLTSISSGLYTEELFYDDQLPVFEGNSPQASLCYNGNINALKHSYHFSDLSDNPGNFAFPTLYGHRYDKANRLVAADAMVGDYVTGLASTAIEQQIGDVEISYDVIGNVLNNYRYLPLEDDGTIIPDLRAMTYSYPNANNLLAEVNLNSSEDHRLFTYDAKGNMMTDSERGLLHVQYDQANMPTSLSLDANNYGVDEGVNMDYFYTSTGQRFAKQLTFDDEVQETEYYFSDATGAMHGIRKTALNDDNTWEIYVNGIGREAKVNSLPNSDVMFWVMPHFYLKDHLGNTRVVTSGGCEQYYRVIEQAVDYYPYGKVLRQYANGEVERYLTTDHERDKETGYDYRGARFYDSDLARFLSTDPLAQKFAGWSPYNYVLGNPINLVDPDGREPNRAQSGTISSFFAQFGSGVKSVNDMYQHLKSNSTSAIRYIYTENSGWIDMNHVFSVFVNGKTATDALEPLSGNANARDALFNGNGETSYYSYEDLPSNEFATTIETEQVRDYGVGYETVPLPLDKVISNVTDALNGAGAADPTAAPNWTQIPADRDRGVVKDQDGNVQQLTPEQLSSGKYVPQNHTSEPYNLENFPAAPTSLEKQKPQ